MTRSVQALQLRRFMREACDTGLRVHLGCAKAAAILLGRNSQSSFEATPHSMSVFKAAFVGNSLHGDGRVPQQYRSRVYARTLDKLAGRNFCVPCERTGKGSNAHACDL